MDDQKQLDTTGAKNLRVLNKLMARIAADLAMGLCTSKDICKRYQLDDAQWELLRVNPTFRGMVKEQLEAWSGDTNARKRIAVKAATALEDSIPEIYAIGHNQDLAPAARLQAFKQLSDMGGATAPQEGKAGAGFAISIHLNNKREPIKIVGSNEPQVQPAGEILTS